MYKVTKQINNDGIIILFDNDRDTNSPNQFTFSSQSFKLDGNTIITSGSTINSLATSTSANLASIISDETGSGSLVFATSPTLVTPILGNATVTSTITKGVDTTGGFGLLTLTTISASKTLTNAQTNTLAIQIPSGAMLLGVQLRNDTLIAGTDNATGLVPITTYSAIYATGATQTINATIAVAKNTKVDKFFNSNAATNILSGATDITLDAGSGNKFTAGGIISAVAYYYQFTSITDAA